MTTNPLDEIAARADAATKGPWEVPHSCDPHLDKVEAPNDNNLVGSICEVRSPQQNAEFIAHAREDVPKLVAALRAVERLADEIDHPNHYRNAEHNDMCADCRPGVGGMLWPCRNYAHADQIRNTIREALG